MPVSNNKVLRTPPFNSHIILILKHSPIQRNAKLIKHKTTTDESTKIQLLRWSVTSSTASLWIGGDLAASFLR